MNYINKLRNNIKLGYAYNFLFFLNITNVIWVIYLTFKGASLFEVGLLESIFHIASFIFEIPTGAIADLYGRKFSVICSRISSIISALIMIFANSFILFAISFIFSALSYNLNSGSYESLTYDSLKELKREDEYKKISGNISAISELAGALAAIIGGILSNKNFIYAYIAAIIVNCLSLLVAGNFTEPKFEKEDNSHSNDYSLLKQVKESVSVLIENKTLLCLILFFELICLSGTTIYFYCQRYFELIGFSKTQIGLIFTIDSLFCAMTSKYAYKIEKKIGRSGIILLLPLITITSITGLSLTHNVSSVIFLVILSSTQGIGYPVFSDYINSLIPSEKRATILSMQSSIFSILMIVLFPIVGLLADNFSFSIAFMFCGITIVPVIIVILKLKKVS